MLTRLGDNHRFEFLAERESVIAALARAQLDHELRHGETSEVVGLGPYGGHDETVRVRTTLRLALTSHRCPTPVALPGYRSGRRP